MTDQKFVELRETRTDVTVLYGDRAYKVRKPAGDGAVELRTHALREDALAREAELNRQLAADVYLGVAHLDDPGGGPAEPILVMRRLPEDRCLSRTIAADHDDGSHLSALVKTLANFHAAARRDPDVSREADPEQLRSRWQALLRRLRDAPADIVGADRPALIEHRALRYLRGRELLLVNRIDTGHVVDGHGALRSGGIFDLPDGFRILGRTLDDHSRYVDVVDDIAALATDLESLGYPGQARRLILDYLAATADNAPRSLVEHYLAYRAVSRAADIAVELAPGSPEAESDLRHQLDIAEGHLRRGTVRLAIVGGLPGTGKTTLSQLLAARTGAVAISTEAVRKHLRYAGTVAAMSGGDGSDGDPVAVYGEVFARARINLAYGRSVVLDDGWSDPVERGRAAELADDMAAEFVEIRCECPPEIVDQRLRHRPGGSHATAPLISIAAAATTAATGWPTAFIVDTSDEPEAVLDTAAGLW